MRKIILSLLVSTMCIASSAFSQDTAYVESTHKRVYMGIGIGLDHGGLGFNFTVYPIRNVSLFGGMGYAMVGLGYNAGIKARTYFKKPGIANPFIMAMYGYNTAINVGCTTKFPFS